jgi:hypothetical protein
VCSSDLKAGEPTKKELVESKYKLPRTIDESRKEKIIEDLKDIIKMKEVLRTRGNLSAPDLDGITIQLIKLERENGAKMLIELIKMALNTEFCPAEWENERIVLLYKA